MFSKEISCLTLTSGIASAMFPNITGDHFGRDESFLATLRALLYNRVPEDEAVHLFFQQSIYSSGQLEGSRPRDCVRAFLRGSPVASVGQGILHIHSFAVDNNSVKACMEALDSGIQDAISGYTPLDDVSSWIMANGKFDTRIYINTELRNTLIFTGPLNMKRWHLLEALVPRYFPWYTDKAPLTQEEIALLKTLTKGNAQEYDERIQEFAGKFDFRTHLIRSKLAGFETWSDRRILQDVRREIREVNLSMEDLNQRFSQLYRNFNDLNAKEMGLVEKINGGSGDENSELMDYFLLNKSLTLMNVSDGEIEFVVATTMSNFDPDAAESMIRNRQGYFYRTYETRETFSNEEMTDDRIERLLRGIFEDETIKLRICAAYSLNFFNGNFRGIEGYTFPREIAKGYTPNQHIQRYHCLGDNTTYIRQAMVQNDYVGAVEACVASAKSVNVFEGVTCGLMFEQVFSNSAGKIIEMPDGSNKTPLEAVLWLEEQDKENVENEGQEDVHE